MRTECSADLFGFAAVEGREVVGGFDGGAITSDAGALLLGAADRAIKLQCAVHQACACALQGSKVAREIIRLSMMQ